MFEPQNSSIFAKDKVLCNYWKEHDYTFKMVCVNKSEKFGFAGPHTNVHYSLGTISYFKVRQNGE